MPENGKPISRESEGHLLYPEGKVKKIKGDLLGEMWPDMPK